MNDSATTFPSSNSFVAQKLIAQNCAIIFSIE